MTENIKAVEEQEVIIEEKARKRPIKFLKEKLANVPAAVKYVGAGVAGAAAVTGVGAVLVNRQNQKKLDEELDDLVIEDFGSDIPEIAEE